MRLHDPLDYWATRRPELALVVEPGGLTYGQAAAITSAWAVRLQELGLKPGDRLALAASNHPNAVLMIMAASKAGLTTVPLNPRLLAADYERFLRDSGARIVAGTQSRAEALAEAAADLDLPKVILDGPFNGWLDVADWPRETTTSLPVYSERVALRSYTSGTTGRPKAAQLQHDVFVPVAARWSQAGMRLEPGDIFYIPLPIMLWAGLMMVEYTVWHGGALQLDDFSPERSLRALANPKVVAATFVVTMMQMMLEKLDAAPDGTFGKPSLRWIIYGGSAVTRTLLERSTEAFGAGLYNCYGCTEASVISLLTPEDHAKALAGDDQVLASVGRLTIDCEAAILDPDEQPLPVGEIGEVCSRGTHVFLGYADDPERNEAAFRGGWYHTGDLGSFDADGYLHLHGRKDHMIKSGGINVYPEEIEKVIARLPGVSSAAVVGQPDAVWGRRIVAAVALVPGTTLTEEDVLASCRAQLAAYKVPRTVTFLDEMPLNATGKILKHVVLERLERGN